MRRKWTDAEIAVMRELYASHTAEEIGRRIDRTAAAVLQKGGLLGLNRKYGADPQLLEFIRVHHARGLLDTEIVREWRTIYPDRPKHRRPGRMLA